MKLLFDNPNTISVFNKSLVLVKSTTEYHFLYDTKLRKQDNENGVDMKTILHKNLNSDLQNVESIRNEKIESKLWLNNISIVHLSFKLYKD